MKITITCECGNEVEIHVSDFEFDKPVNRNDFFVYKDYESLQVSCNKCNKTVFI